MGPQVIKTTVTIGKIEGMATHSIVLVWRIRMNIGAW